MRKPVPFVLAAALLGAVLPAMAGTWPAKPVKAIVPVGAGSTTDLMPRIVFEALSARLGQPIVVENRVGAGGTIGSAFVARAEPDGYTFLVNSSAHTIVPALYADLAYRPARDFVGVVALGSSPAVLVVAPQRGYRGVSDLLAAAQAKPGTMTFSSVGIGTATHLAAERLRVATGIDVTHVPYKGGAEAMMEVVAGRVDFFMAPVGLALPLIAEGKLKPLAVNAARRSAALPQVPTLAETGVADAEYPTWFGVFAPAHTPQEIVERMHRETLETLREPALAERLAKMGLEPMPLSPRELDALVQREIAQNALLVKKIGLKVE